LLSRAIPGGETTPALGSAQRSAETLDVEAMGRSRGVEHLIEVLRERWIVAAAALLLAGATGFWMASSAQRSRPSLDGVRAQGSGTLEVAGLARPVRIDRDRHGVPHIDAASEADAFYALGFCHAQDRLAQLLHLRRSAYGAAAEEVGAAAVESDQLARLLDFRGLADRQWQNLAPAARRALEAYAAGVNARIAALARDAADPAPRADEIEPWRAQDSLALYKLFAWGLAESIDASLVLNDLVADLGAADTVRFFPAQSASRPGAVRATASSSAPWLPRAALALRASVGLAAHGVGSSAFAVGGARTENGFPVLVADSHFEPISPAALYLAHLRSPGGDIAGATLAGVPVFWWGRNPKLAWAAVNAGMVVTDLYNETLRNGGAEAHDGRSWRPVEQRDAEIRVRGSADVSLALRRTAHGPLLPAGEAQDQAIAIAWTGARSDGGGAIEALLAVAHAGDGDAVREALHGHDDPPIAMVWAEAAGGAGLQVAGWVPHRRLAAQLLPLPGRARWYDWEERVPFASLPSERLEGGDGFLVAADQRFDAAAGEDPIDSTWRTGARAARLRALIGDAKGDDLRAFAALLTDDRLDRSVALVETALALAGEPLAAQEASELARLLREWDGRAAIDSVGSAAYHVFLDVLAEELFEPRFGEERLARYLALPALDLEALVSGVLQDAAAGGAGDVWSEPEAVRAAVVKSLREAWLALSFEHGPDPRRWGWGALHELRFRALAPNRPDLGPFRYGGAPHAVLTAGYSLGHPFAVSVASTARFAVDTATLDIALTAIAPGQSESTRAPRTNLDGWLAGRFALLATRRLEVEDLSVEKLILEPRTE
jgi:penicillin G amidase